MFENWSDGVCAVKWYSVRVGESPTREPSSVGTLTEFCVRVSNGRYEA